MMKKVIIVILSVMMIAGFSIALFPLYAKLINNAQITATAQQIECNNNSSAAQTIENANMLEAAHKYNVQLQQPNFRYDDYYNTLNCYGNIIGVLRIKKLNLTMSIYHGTEDDVLRKGAGHLSDTLFPVGDNGVSIITSHSGLPNATLFTDLNKLQLNDTFEIVVAGELTEYKVSKIDVVLPQEIYSTVATGINNKSSYVNLVTCTPTGVNTHRLIVRGVKIKCISQEVAQISHIQSSFSRDIINVVIVTIIPIVIIIVICFLLKRRKIC